MNSGDAAPPGAPAAAIEVSASAATGGAALGKSALIYGVGTVLSRGASLIMLPVYTRVLSPGDYGLLQMLDMTLDIVSILVSVGCTMGLMRFYFKATDAAERQRIVASALVLQLALNAIGSVLMVAAASPIHEHLLQGEGALWYVFLAAANFTLSSLATVPLLVMQIRQHAALYAVATLGRLVMQLTLNIVFLVGLRMGPLGILLSTMITSTVLGGVMLAWLLRTNGLATSRAAMRDLVRFGIPYQFVTAGTFLLTFGDRFFLSQHRGLAAVGIYSLAYQFGFLAHQIGYAPISRAWEPMRFAEVHEPKALRDAKSRSGFLYLNLFLVTTVVGMAIFVHPVLRVMSAPEFHGAADIVPVILVAFVLQGWSGVMQFGIDVSEQTRYSTYATWISVVLILALYAWMIPAMGAMGAALATVITFAVRTLLFHGFAQRLWHVDYGWPSVFRLAGLGAATTLAMFALRPEAMLTEVALGAALVAAYATAVWYIVIDAEDRHVVARFITSRIGRVTAHFARA